MKTINKVHLSGYLFEDVEKLRRLWKNLEGEIESEYNGLLSVSLKIPNDKEEVRRSYGEVFDFGIADYHLADFVSELSGISNGFDLLAHYLDGNRSFKGVLYTGDESIFKQIQGAVPKRFNGRLFVVYKDPTKKLPLFDTLKQAEGFWSWVESFFGVENYRSVHLGNFALDKLSLGEKVALSDFSREKLTKIGDEFLGRVGVHRFERVTKELDSDAGDDLFSVCGVNQLIEDGDLTYPVEVKLLSLKVGKESPEIHLSGNIQTLDSKLESLDNSFENVFISSLIANKVLELAQASSLGDFKNEITYVKSIWSFPLVCQLSAIKVFNWMVGIGRSKEEAITFQETVGFPFVVTEAFDVQVKKLDMQSGSAYVEMKPLQSNSVINRSISCSLLKSDGIRVGGQLFKSYMIRSGGITGHFRIPLVEHLNAL